MVEDVIFRRVILLQNRGWPRRKKEEKKLHAGIEQRANMSGPQLTIVYHFQKREPCQKWLLFGAEKKKNGSTLPVFPEKLVLMTYHIEGYQRLKKEQAQHQTEEKPTKSKKRKKKATDTDDASCYFQKLPSEKNEPLLKNKLKNIMKNSGPKICGKKKSKIKICDSEASNIENNQISNLTSRDISKKDNAMPPLILFDKNELFIFKNQKISCESGDIVTHDPHVLPSSESLKDEKCQSHVNLPFNPPETSLVNSCDIKFYQNGASEKMDMSSPSSSSSPKQGTSPSMKLSFLKLDNFSSSIQSLVSESNSVKTNPSSSTGDHTNSVDHKSDESCLISKKRGKTNKSQTTHKRIEDLFSSDSDDDLTDLLSKKTRNSVITRKPTALKKSQRTANGKSTISKFSGADDLPMCKSKTDKLKKFRFKKNARLQILQRQEAAPVNTASTSSDQSGVSSSNFDGVFESTSIVSHNSANPSSSENNLQSTHTSSFPCDPHSFDTTCLTLTDDELTPPLTDKDISNKIKNTSHVCELGEQELAYLVRINKQYLVSIFSGKDSSRRHQEYNAGLRSRVNLTYQVPLRLFTDHQCRLLMQQLIDIFCTKHREYLDYVMRVLHPEMLIKVYMTVHNVDRNEAEERMFSPDTTSSIIKMEPQEQSDGNV